MASLPQPMPYSYYPSSGSVHHAGKPTTPDEGRGSFGPVLVVLAVITFLATAACIAGRLCGRRSSSASSGRSSSAEQQCAADAEKGLGAKHPVVAMRPLPSSRAAVHDDVFEIKFTQVKPAGMGRERDDTGGDGGGTSRVQALPAPQLGLPRQYATAPGFRCAPAANGGGVARQPPHPQVRGPGGESCTPAFKNQSR
ncbi:unnamed protein product [Alopecurus aequalis]